jgi:hypothetical protein
MLLIVATIVIAYLMGNFIGLIGQKVPFGRNGKAVEM